MEAGYEAEIPHAEIEAGTPHDRAMHISLRKLLTVRYGIRVAPYFDGVAMLEGWDGSQGAMVERIVAEACGIPCKTVDEWLGVA